MVTVDMTDETWTAGARSELMPAGSPPSDQATWGSQTNYSYYSWPGTSEYTGDDHPRSPQDSWVPIEPRSIPALEFGTVEPQSELESEPAPEFERPLIDDSHLHPLYTHTHTNNGPQEWCAHYEMQMEWSHSTPGTPPSHAAHSADDLRPEVNERRSKSLPPAVVRYVTEPQDYERLACGRGTENERRSIRIHRDRARHRISKVDFPSSGNSTARDAQGAQWF